MNKRQDRRVASAATSSTGRVRRGILRIDDATAGAPLPVQHSVDDRGGASHTCLDEYCADGAISTAGPAFHAGIAIPHTDPFVVEGQHPVWTDLHARAAPHAQLGGYLQGHDVFQIDEILHDMLLKKA
jgi:hypothetical protein